MLQWSSPKDHKHCQTLQALSALAPIQAQGCQCQTPTGWPPLVCQGQVYLAPLLCLSTAVVRISSEWVWREAWRQKQCRQNQNTNKRRDNTMSHYIKQLKSSSLVMFFWVLYKDINQHFTYQRLVNTNLYIYIDKFALMSSWTGIPNKVAGQCMWGNQLLGKGLSFQSAFLVTIGIRNNLKHDRYISISCWCVFFSSLS